jgi:hypothetical protein
MQRLFFHLHECGTVTVDEEGVEVESLAEARVRAFRAARSIMSAEVAQGQLCLSCHINVEDDQGTILLTLPFREALQVTGL